KQSITISNSSGLSEEEIERMVRDAEEHKAEDEKRREEIEIRNKAEAFIAKIDETLETENANVTEDQKAEVKKLRDELQKAIDDNDIDTLRTKMDELEKAANEMAQAMYSQQQDTASSTQDASDDNVVDADFTEKN
ncbi:MAG: Hsp70 family protein, partial [Bacillota bacterium]|nr:Hsp70 family protein [Bacillota bacterium]